MDAGRIVDDYMAAWGSGDLEKVMSFLADDCVYHNVPVPEVTGKQNVRAAFVQFAQHMEGIELIVLHKAATGNVVFNDRIDRFRFRGKQLDLPVAGLFVIDDAGKIAVHRDYFNYPTWKDATGISLDMEKGT